MSYILRGYQRDAVAATIATLRTHPRATVLSACGTGKTVSMLAVHETLAATLTGFFCPSLSLISQTVTSWQSLGKSFAALIVCSDPNVGKATPDDITEFELRRSLPDVEVTGSVERITEFLDSARALGIPHVLFGTYQSSHKVAQAQRHTATEFDLVIADEAHFLGTLDRKTSRAMNRTGEAVRDGTRIRAARRVFTTATQKVVTSTKVEGTETHASMDDEALFGPVAYELSLRDAIKLPDRADGLQVLTEYKILVLGAATADVDLLYPDRTFDLDIANAETREAIALVAVQKLREDYGVTRLITYHSAVARAERFAATLRDRNFGYVATITGDVPMEVRHSILAQLGLGGIVTNVNCLTEGIDVPALEAVLLVDPRSSEIDIIQIIGRAVRPFRYPNGTRKETGLLVIPILMDDDGGMDETVFENVLNVLRKMAANDERLHQEIISRGVQARGDDWPEQSDQRILAVDTVGADATIRTSLDRQLSLRAYDAGISQWDKGFAVAVSWHNAHPELLPNSGSNDATEVAVSAWLRRQRSLAGGRNPASRVFTDSRRGRLDVAWPGWDSEMWDAALGRLVRWAEVNPGRRPSTTAADPEEQVCSRWLNQQRSQLNPESPTAYLLTPERRARLTAGFPEWDASTDAWSEGLERVTAWRAQNPTRKPSNTASAPAEERFVAGWLSYQRTQNNGTKNSHLLTPERRAQVDAAWPDWDAPFDPWAENLERVKAWRAQNPNRKPRLRSSSEDEQFAYRWLVQQRSRANGKTQANLLTPERRAQVDAVWPNWDAPADTWESNLQRLAVWKSRNPNQNPKYTAAPTTEERFLATWLTYQRSQAKGSKNSHLLTPERRSQLDALLPNWSE